MCPVKHVLKQSKSEVKVVLVSTVTGQQTEFITTTMS